MSNIQKVYGLIPKTWDFISTSKYCNEINKLFKENNTPIRFIALPSKTAAETVTYLETKMTNLEWSLYQNLQAALNASINYGAE